MNNNNYFYRYIDTVPTDYTNTVKVVNDSIEFNVYAEDIPFNSSNVININENSISQSIRNILLTTPTEILFRPSFGSGLQQFLFMPATITTINKIKNSILSTLHQYEKRISIRLSDIEATFNENSLMITIQYVIRESAEENTLTLNIGK